MPLQFLNVFQLLVIQTPTQQVLWQSGSEQFRRFYQQIKQSFILRVQFYWDQLKAENNQVFW